MEAKKIICVLGATGTQGGSVVRFLKKDGKFHIRALTRNAEGAAAQELKKQGIEVVSADLDNKDSLVAAFKGAYGVFGVTNFWEGGQMNFDKEVQQGKLMADAAKETNIQHLVWSSLDHKSDCPHFESKVIVEEYLFQIGVPTTALLTAFYYENWLSPMMRAISKNDKGEYVFTVSILSDAKICMYAAEDTGAWVVEAFNNRDKYLKKHMPVGAEFISVNEVAAVWEKVMKKKAVVPPVTLADMEAFANSGAFQKEIYTNMIFFVRNQSGIRDPAWTKAAYPQTQNWEAFLTNHLDKFSAL